MMQTRRALTLLALGSWITALASSCGEAPVVEPKPPKPTLAEQSLRLPNGLRVELLSGPCDERAALVVLFEVGTDHDPAGRSGMAHLVARLWSVSASPGPRIEAGSDHTVYSVVVSGDQVARELDAVAARMAQLEVSQSDLERARAQVLAEIVDRHGADAALTAMSYAAESVRPSRGEGWRGGIAAEVEAIDRAEVEAFWRAHFKPRNARVIVAGTFDAQAMRARVEAAFTPLARGSAPVQRNPADSSVTGTLVMGDAPAAVAVAVAAPAPSEPLYPAFLILAARLMAAPSEARVWEARYDPLAAPELLFVTAPLQPGEPPEPAAAGVRAGMATLVARPLTPADLAAARETFGLFLGLDALAPATCARDPRALAVARARRAQLGLDELPLAPSLEATTQEELEQAAGLFEARRTTAVIAGGAIH